MTPQGSFGKRRCFSVRMPKCCNNPCFRDRKLRALCTVSFGLGMVLAQISPEGLVLFIAAVILVALGVAVLRTL